MSFDPRTPSIGPFPTDFLTVPDPAQVTGRRVNMPLPDCSRETSACGELALVNQLDGFSLQPRVRVVFSAPVNPDTLRDGIKFVWLDRIRTDEAGLGPVGTLTPINEVVWDGATNTAYAKPDAFFDQSRRYALFVTDAVKDTRGNAVVADEGFLACLAGSIGGDYCVRLGDAVREFGSAAGPARVVGGSVFTTATATAALESARRQLDVFAPGFERLRVVSIADVASITWHKQVRTSGERFEDAAFPAPVALLASVGTGRVAFGSIASPRYLLRAGLPIFPGTPTGAQLEPQGTDRLPFHVWLPASPPPSGGYSVVLAGHGITDSRFGLPTALNAGLIQRGVAIVAMNAFGHGFGADSTLRVTGRGGDTIELPGGGRGIDLDGDGAISDSEGCIIAVPGAPVNIRDCLRQSAVDWMAMVRAIRLGMDLDGDGTVDLNGDRISLIGQSLGSFYGAMVMAVDPSVISGVLNVGGGSASGLLTNSAYRPLFQAYLGYRTPALLNTVRNGIPDFIDNLPLRYEPVRTSSIPGAIEIQNLLSVLEWIETPGAPYAYATHFRSSTLPGVPLKRVLFQFAYGDQNVPNPVNTQLIRAANMRELSQFVRYDRLRAAVPALSANPHTFILNIAGSAPAAALAIAAQTQAASFLLGSSDAVPDANAQLRQLIGLDLFETPAFLPEQWNFLQ